MSYNSSKFVNGTSLDPSLYGALLVSGNMITPAEDGAIKIDYVYDNVGPQDGLVSKGGYTDDLTPTISGYDPEVAGLTFSIVINAEVVATVTANSTGYWSYTPQIPLQPDHEYIFQTVLQDPGSKEFFVSLPYTVYTTEAGGDIPVNELPDAPMIISAYDDVGSQQGNLTAGAQTDDSRPELTGIATANSTVHLYMTRPGGVKYYLGDVSTNSDGVWHFAVPANSAFSAAGYYSFTASVTDPAGNTSNMSKVFGLNYLPVPETTTYYDALQDLPYNGVYYGNGFAITSDTPMGHSDGTSSSNPGLTILNNYGTNHFMQIDFNSSVVDVGFNISGLQNDLGGARVVIFGSNGSVLFNNYVQADGFYQQSHFSFEAPSNVEIASVRVYSDNVGAGLSIDHLSYSEINSFSPYGGTLLPVNADDHDLMLNSLSAEHLSVLNSQALVELQDGQDQTLHLSLDNILSHAQANQFIFDGQQQLAVTGDAGDKVELHNAGSWNSDGMVMAGGVIYDVWQQSSSNLELLVQHGMEVQYS